MSETHSEHSSTALVTGATGYIGQKLALHLAENGTVVHAIVRNPAAGKLLGHPNIRLFEGDLQDPESIRKAIRGCRHVYHVAGLARLVHKDASQFYKVNVEGTRVLLEAAAEAHVEKFIYTSTTGVIGPSLNNPMSEDDPRIIGYDNDYEISKELGEGLVLEYCQNGLQGVIVSPSRVYGPGITTFSNGVNRFIEGFLKKGFSVVPKCDPISGNYAYIDDVVRGHVLAMKHAPGGQRYILGGENVAFGDLMRVIREHAKSGVFIKIPTSVIKSAAFMIQLKSLILNQTPALTPRMVDRLFLHCAFSSEKAVRDLGYTITPFSEGIRNTIAFLKNGKKT